MSELESYAARLQAATTTAEIWPAVLPFAEAYGIQRVSYHHSFTLPSNTRVGTDVFAVGFPEDWVAEYVGRKLYHVDPIPRLALETAEPFLWSDVQKLRHTTPEERDFLNLLAKQDLGDGLALQVFGPNMRNGYVGLGFGPRTPALGAQDLRVLQMAAQLAHLRYCTLVPYDAPGALTRREQEVLAWIARGKSNAVIAQILNVSPHTVDTLVRRIYDKLAVSDRTTAAIRGLGAGLITLDAGHAA